MFTIINKMAKIVIGIVGQIGSGKDTAISFLEKKGFVNFSLSDQIRVELKNRGNLDFTRKDIQSMGNEMREKHGDEYWARQAWKEALKSGKEKLILSSIRHPAEAEFLKKQKNSYFLAVVADQRIRFERKLASTRSDDQDILTWEKFKKLDDFETKGAGEHGQQVKETLALADFTIENNGTFEELKGKVYEVSDQMEGGKNA